MSPFCNQIRITYSMYRAVRGVTCCCSGCDGMFPAKWQHFTSQLERCTMCFLCPPSHSVRFSLSPVSFPFFADIACLTLSTIVRKEVCHITSVFVLAGMCVGLLQMVFTWFRNSSETRQTNYPLESQLWIFIHTTIDVIFSKEPYICCTQSLPVVDFTQWHRSGDKSS